MGALGELGPVRLGLSVTAQLRRTFSEIRMGLAVPAPSAPPEPEIIPTVVPHRRMDAAAVLSEIFERPRETAFGGRHDRLPPVEKLLRRIVP